MGQIRNITSIGEACSKAGKDANYNAYSVEGNTNCALASACCRTTKAANASQHNWFRKLVSAAGLYAAFFIGLNTAICGELSAAEPPTAIDSSDSPVITEISTVDNPAPYRHLDWLSADEIASWPAAQRPSFGGRCNGLYLAPTIPSTFTNPELAPIEASADRYSADTDGTAIFDGDVIIQQGNRQLESDHIELNQKTQSTLMEGNVRIRQDGMLLTGDKATFSLNSKDLDITNAQYVVHASHIRGAAKRIYNEQEDTLILSDGSYTTCEPGSTAWLFEAQKISLNNTNGWGAAKHATLKVNDVPVFYFPWMIFPIDERRQTGFLFPSFGFDGDNGTDMAAPLYLNIAPNVDATLTFRNLTARGKLLDGELRYLLPIGEGQFASSYLADDKRTDTDRELSLFKHRGNFNNGWSINADYTKVSDDDYFIDLDTTLDANAKTHLDQKALLGYQSEFWNSSILVQDYQTIDALITDSNRPYRKMPQIRFGGRYNMSENTIGANNLPIEWDLAAEFTHFEHPEESNVGINEAQRSHLSPRVTYNFMRPWGYLKPSLQGYFTHYELDGDSALFAANVEEMSPNIQSYTTSIDSGLIFERQLSFNNQTLTQTLEPRLFYLYSPRVDQDDAPAFDSAALSFSYNQMFRNNRFSGLDRVGDASQVSLGLTSRFLAADSGRELLRLSLGQSFYLKDRVTQLTPTTAPDTEATSVMVGQLAWSYNDELTLYSEVQWDQQRNNTHQTDVQLSYRNQHHQLFNVSYRQQGGDTGAEFENTLEQVDFSFAWTLNPNWSIASRWLHDIKEKRTFEALGGITYDSCCWSVQLVRRVFLKEGDDDDLITRQGTFIQFQLKGLSGIGSTLESILDKAISGYAQRRKALAHQF